MVILLKPSVNPKLKNPQIAMVARVIALNSILFLTISGVSTILTGFASLEIAGGLFLLLVAANTWMVEDNKIDYNPLRESMYRGITFFLLGILVIGSGFGLLANVGGIFLLLAGAIYAVYHFQ